MTRREVPWEELLLSAERVAFVSSGRNFLTIEKKTKSSVSWVRILRAREGKQQGMSYYTSDVGQKHIMTIGQLVMRSATEEMHNRLCRENDDGQPHGLQ